MRKCIKLLAASLAAITAMSCTSATTFADKIKTVDGVRYLYSDSGVNKGKYTGWAKSSKGKMYFKNGIKVTKNTTINGIRYKFSSDGYCLGKFTGWTKSSSGRRYWKNGVMYKNKWVKSSDGKYYYAGSNGYMVTGWAEVTRIGGKYSFFDSNGVWDGNIYWNKQKDTSDVDEKLSKTVKLKIKPVGYIGEYTNLSYGHESNARSYLENNSYYELEVPTAIADLLSSGDKIVVNAVVERGEKVNGNYEYYLIVRKPVYSYVAVDNNSNGTIDDYELADAVIGRLDLLNRLLVIKNGKLDLDSVFSALGLTWDEISNNEFIEEYLLDEGGLYVNSNMQKYYALFGGYNKYNKNDGTYEYYNGMPEKELVDLMKQIIAEKLEAKKQAEADGDDVDFKQWVSNAINTTGFWIEAEIIK